VVACGIGKHLLTLREKRGSGGIVSGTEERLHRNLVRSEKLRIEAFGV
jgi:hypothetical protein